MKIPVLLVAAFLLLVSGLLRFEAVSSTGFAHDAVRGDAVDYLFYGYNLRQYHVYSSDRTSYLHDRDPAPDAVRAPAYGVFVALFMDMDSARTHTKEGFISSIKPVLFAQAFLSTLTVIIVFLMARRFLPLWAAAAAGVMTALSPHLVNANTYLLSESLFALFFYGGLLLLVGPATIKRYCIAGMLLALASLTRPTVEYFLPLLAVVMAVIFEPRQRAAWGAALTVYLVAIVAWKARNLLATGSASDPQLMVNFIHHGMYPGFMYDHDVLTLGQPYAYDPDLDPAEPRLGLVLDVLGRRALASPSEYLGWYLLGKPLALFRWDIVAIGDDSFRNFVMGDIYQYATATTPYASNPAFIASYLLSRLCHLPVLAASFLAGIAVWLPGLQGFWGQQQRPLRIIALALLFIIGIHMVGAPFPRYAIPFLPLTYLLAAGLLAGLWHGRQSRRKTIEGAGALE